MSVIEATPQKWLEKGSLRYLAHILRVSTKQATRYWDDGCVPGRYRTSKGHRRIRYKDDTVQIVEFRVRHSKRRNLAIRYHTKAINYRGTVIPVKGCTNVRAVYQRARNAGLDDCDAWNAAYSFDTSDSDRNLTLELLWAAKGTSPEEVGESLRFFAPLPLSHLCEACDAKDFRSRARAVWRTIVSTHKRSYFLSSSPEERAKRRKRLEALRNLLLEANLKSFIRAWSEATELHRRVWEFIDEGLDDEKFLAFKKSVKIQAKVKQLEIAALALKRAGVRPSASALARQLGISRPALYRTFGRDKIHEALRKFHNDK